jgi:hypothetical protein
MTRSEAQEMLIGAEIKAVRSQIASQTDRMMRMAEEMQQAVERGYGLSCPASNLTSVATDLACLGARLEALQHAEKSMREIEAFTV